MAGGKGLQGRRSAGFAAGVAGFDEDGFLAGVADAGDVAEGFGEGAPGKDEVDEGKGGEELATEAGAGPHAAGEAVGDDGGAQGDGGEEVEETAEPVPTFDADPGGGEDALPAGAVAGAAEEGGVVEVEDAGSGGVPEAGALAGEAVEEEPFAAHPVDEIGGFVEDFTAVGNIHPGGRWDGTGFGGTHPGAVGEQEEGATDPVDGVEIAEGISGGGEAGVLEEGLMDGGGPAGLGDAVVFEESDDGRGGEADAGGLGAVDGIAGGQGEVDDAGAFDGALAGVDIGDDNLHGGGVLLGEDGVDAAQGAAAEDTDGDNN